MVNPWENKWDWNLEKTLQGRERIADQSFLVNFKGSLLLIICYGIVWVTFWVTGAIWMDPVPPPEEIIQILHDCKWGKRGCFKGEGIGERIFSHVINVKIPSYLGFIVSTTWSNKIYIIETTHNVFFCYLSFSSLWVVVIRQSIKSLSIIKLSI